MINRKGELLEKERGRKTSIENVQALFHWKFVKLGRREERNEPPFSRLFYPRVRSKRADTADIIYGQHDSIKHPYKIIGY